MKKKILSILLSITLLLGIFPLSVTASEFPFTDVPENAWYKDAVTYAYENGLFNGTSETTFSPDSPMTRGMFVQVLANKTSNYDKTDYEGKSSFSDVNVKKYYAPAIEWASKAGLVDGIGDGKFAPDQNVSREQMAKIMYNYAIKTGNDVSLKDNAIVTFPDAAKTASWAKEPMKWAVTHGVINGSDGKLNPQNIAKRCEVAQVIANADQTLAKTEIVIEKPEDPNEPDWDNPDSEYSEPLAPYLDFMYDEYPNVPDPEKIIRFDPTSVLVNKMDLGNGFAYVFNAREDVAEYYESAIFRSLRIYDIQLDDNFMRLEEEIPVMAAGNKLFIARKFINYETRQILWITGSRGRDPNDTNYYFYIGIGRKLTEKDILSVYPPYPQN